MARGFSCLAGVMGLLIGIGLQAAAVEGDWVTFDEATGNAASVVRLEVTEAGHLQGRIVEILWTPPGVGPNPTCARCPEPFKDRPLVGLRILWELKEASAAGERWIGGRLLDPRNGNLYRCRLKLDEPDRLELRGYLGLPLLGKTRTWIRREAADLAAAARAGERED